MKPKTLILMVVAVVCGLGASYMTSRLIAERDDAPQEAPPIERVTLLIAKKNLDIHTAMRKKPEDFFQPKEFVKEDAPPGALAPEEMPKLKNKFLRRGLRKGDHLTAEDLMDKVTGLVALPLGMRAVGIRVSAEKIAGGFASLPGSHVDIFWTTRRGGDGDTFTKMLLEDVIVLAADTNTNNDGGGAMVANVVTVALLPEDALKVTLASETGSLQLAVRQLEDAGSAEKDSITLGQLARDHSSKNKKEELPVFPEPEPQPQPRAVVEAPKPVDPVVPQQQLTKVTVTVRNGPDVQVRTFWVDENDEIVVPGPQPDQRPVPPPAATNKSKKDDDGN
jgi:pilus assembly protein CpaB